MLEGSSGMKWAMESSSFATLSTIRFLKAPVGVSSMTPMGIFAIRPVMASRIFFSMVKEILWDIREDRQVSSIFMIWQTAAPPQRNNTSLGVAVPRYKASARTATIKNGPMPNSSSQDSQEDGEEHFTVVFSHESKELPNRSRFFRLHNQPPFRPQKMQGGYCNFKGPVLKFELRCNITV